MRALIASGADPGIHNNDEQTPLDLASTEQVREVYAEELLQAVARSEWVSNDVYAVACGAELTCYYAYARFQL